MSSPTTQRSEPNGTWLDIGCGMGHSLARLADSAERILAIDLAWTSLQGLPKSPRLEKTRADASQLPLQDASFDYAVCFQVVEHLETELAIRILREIRRVLKPGGVGYITTPNARWRLLPGQAPTNRYHLIEYHPDEIVDFCARAEIDRECIKGVIGLHGAQNVELARTKKNPFLVWGPHSPRAWSQWRTLPRPPDRRAARRLGRRSVNTEDQGREWFSLTDDFAEGLDFWIEVRGNTSPAA